MRLDDLGAPVDLPAVVGRVVSLVPSLTESVARSAPGLLVAATEWCTQPAGLAVRRVGGTKNPDVAAIIALAPDVVLMNEEENRQPDIDALRAAGLAVWVSRVRTVDEAFWALERLLTLACRLPPPGWLAEARSAWSARSAGIHPPPGAPRSALIPIWRRPWMFVGRDTFAGDVLARLGVDNALAGHPERYPKLSLDEVPAVDLVVLPDEPYQFSAEDGPESFPGVPVALVSGRLLTWYGPSLVEAATELPAQLRRAVPA
jgi:ABC-type Fe3+-hydroxamate transport system substrate-binding protein